MNKDIEEKKNNTNEIFKYQKKKNNNFKTKYKSNHKHEYKLCLIQYKFSKYDKIEVVHVMEYCDICMKLGNSRHDLEIKETIQKGKLKFNTHYTSNELLEKYSNLPLFKINTIFDKYISIDNKVVRDKNGC